MHKQLLPEQGKAIGRRCRTVADGPLKSVADKVIMQRDRHHRRETRSKKNVFRNGIRNDGGGRCVDSNKTKKTHEVLQ